LADVNAEIGVSIDTSGALAQLKALQREIARFHTSVAKSSDAAALAQRDLQRNFINGVNAIQGFSAELRTVKTTAENFTDSLERNKFSMREYFRYAGASTKTFGRMFSSELDTVNKVAVENVKRLQTQYIKMGRDATGAMQAIAVMPTKLDMTNLTTQTQLAAQKQAIFNQLVKQGSTNLLNFGKNTQWAGRQLMVGFTIPLMGLGSVATRTFMDMETAAIKFRKVYGDLFTPAEETQFALESIQALGQEFTKYGIAVADTVSLAAEAAAAGFSGADLQAQVTQATRLQVLGQIDQQKALETTISLQNAFKISSVELTDAINFLNAVENQTVVSLDDITTAIPKAAPIVKELGGDVKDLAFFMAAMKEGGINASEGANALKSGLASLINPTDKAKGMLMDMGINIDQIVEKNVGNLKGTVVEFAKALDGLSNLQRQRAIEQLFGKFQQARLSALFDNVIRDGNQASRVLDLASASMEDLASLAEKELGITADSAMNKFRKSIEDLKVSLAPVGQVFLQIVTPLLEKLNKLLEWFNGLPDSTKQAIAKVVLYLGGLAPVILMTIGLMANFVANGIKGLMLLRTGFLKLTGQSKVLGEQTNYLTAEQQSAVAAAASLEQSHMRLQQAFTGEAGAVRQLIAEYQRMIAAQNAAAARFPGMMQPGTRAKKYASGIVSVPGPKGAGDIIPAMLSPGEAVIPADMTKKYGPLISGMVNDSIPGFMAGDAPAFAHASMPFLPGSFQYQEGLRIAGIEELAKQFPQFIKVVSNLVAELPQRLNIAMKTGASVESFKKEYENRAGKFLSSAKIGGLDIASKENIIALQNLENEIGKRTVALAKGTKQGLVTDELFAKATREVIDEYMKLEGAAKNAATALNNSSQQIGQIRVSASQKAIREGLASGVFTSTRKPGQKQNQIMFGNTNIARESASSPGSFYSGNPISPKGSYRKQAKRSALILGEESVNAVAIGAQTKSPSRKTIQVGQDIARGLQVGILDQIDETKAAAQKLSNAATTLINPKTGRPFTQQDIAAMTRVTGPQVSGMAGGKNTVFLGMPEMPAQERKGRLSGIRGAVGRGVGRVAGAGGGFGLTGLLFSLSMLPGKFGQLAQSIMPAVFALQAVGMLGRVIGGLPTLFIAMAAGIYQLNRVAKKAAEEIADAAKKEAEARYGSAEAVEQYAEFTGRALPSAREFSRNNRQLISASGEAVKRFAEFYGQKGNRSTSVINQAAMKSPQAGMQAAAMDVAQRAAIFGLGPADIAANIKAAADLIGADQVKLKMAVQQILSPDGKDITKEPLTVKARMQFLQEQGRRNVEGVRQSVSGVGKIQTPDLGAIKTKGKESLSTLGFYAGISKTLERGPLKFLSQIGPLGEASRKFGEIQSNVQSATVQLSIAMTQEKEALALLNAQYVDGLITKKEYDAQFAVSFANMDQLEQTSKDLVAELNKIDSSGELAASAVKDLGNEALGALKKTNPALFKKISDALSKLDTSSQIDIYMGYARGSLTILDLAKLPQVLKDIDGKSASVALKIIGESGLSTGATGLASIPVLEADLKRVNKLLEAGYNTDLIRERDSLIKQIADAKKAELEAAKAVPGATNIDGKGKGKGAGAGDGKFVNPYEKEIKALDRKRDILKDISEEMDRQVQYQMKQMDLLNQASKAKISGNYLEAAALQQQAMFEGAKFTRESGITQLDRIIGLAQERSGIVSDTKKLTATDTELLGKLRTGNYQGISPLPLTPKVGFNAGAMGFSGSTTTIGGTMYTVTMNITGDNPSEIADKVISKLKVLENKNNKTNKVGNK
jgi:TP901 family phage tail tape measure protein